MAHTSAPVREAIENRGHVPAILSLTHRREDRRPDQGQSGTPIPRPFASRMHSSSKWYQ